MSRAEDLAGNVLHITPQSGDTINPLISGPIVTIIPEKIKLSYTLLDQARVSLSAIQPQYADPFSETERAAYAFKQRGAVFCGKTAGGKRGMR